MNLQEEKEFYNELSIDHHFIHNTIYPMECFEIRYILNKQNLEEIKFICVPINECLADHSEYKEIIEKQKNNLIRDLKIY